MAHSTPTNLRIYHDPSETTAQESVEPLPELAPFFQSFRDATGWSLEFRAGEQPERDAEAKWSAPIDPGVGTSPGYLALCAPAKPPEDSTAGQDRGRIALRAAKSIAGSTAPLLGELLACRSALAQREAAEALRHVDPPRSTDPVQLAERLQAVLQGGAEAIGCQAAGLYLLDAATSQLKLRSCWGLPVRRLADTARPLQGAVADLEALSGHAVVLQDDALSGYWCVPETAGAAVCVPVSSPTAVMGTLWFFSHGPRQFSDPETNLAEIIAGRLAAELEREALLDSGGSPSGHQRDIDAAVRLQQSQLNVVAPSLDGWDLAGWTEQAHGLGGNFHDWFLLKNHSLALVVADAVAHGITAALTAQTVRATIRAHAKSTVSVARVMSQSNQTLWTGSAGDQYSAALLAAINPDSGTFQYTTAGAVRVLHVKKDRCESLCQQAVPLGIQPGTAYEQSRTVIEPGDVVLCITDSVHDAIDASGRALGHRPLADLLLAHREAPASELAELVRQRIDDHAGQRVEDQTAIVIQREP